MSTHVTDLLTSLTSWLKTHPFVSFILSIAPVFGIALAISNVFYQSTIAEYRQQIDVLESKLNDALAKGVTGDALHLNKNTNSAQQTSINSFVLKLDKSKLFWGGKGRITLDNTYKGLQAVSVSLFLGSLKQSYMVYVNERKVFTFENTPYVIDVLGVENNQATIAISQS